MKGLLPSNVEWIGWSSHRATGDLQNFHDIKDQFVRAPGFMGITLSVNRHHHLEKEPLLPLPPAQRS
jgi:hypothetical protein